MDSTYFIISLVARAAFTAALIGFVLLSPFTLSWGCFNPDEGDEIFVRTLCGGTYIIGSIVAIGDTFRLPMMVTLGVFLNLLGAVYWTPSWVFGDPVFAVFGIALTLVWCGCIVLRVKIGDRE